MTTTMTRDHTVKSVVHVVSFLCKYERFAPGSLRWTCNSSDWLCSERTLFKKQMMDQGWEFPTDYSWFYKSVKHVKDGIGNTDYGWVIPFRDGIWRKLWQWMHIRQYRIDDNMWKMVKQQVLTLKRTKAIRLIRTTSTTRCMLCSIVLGRQFLSMLLF